MITIKNSQRKIKVNISQIRLNIQKILDAAGYSDFDIGVWFTTNRTIRLYNKQYRKKDAPTDILSFPYHHIKAGQKITTIDPEEKNLGDMIISLEYAKKDATVQNRSLMEYLTILLAHGIAHLLGYDHQTEQSCRQMQRKERELLGGFSKYPR